MDLLSNKAKIQKALAPKIEMAIDLNRVKKEHTGSESLLMRTRVFTEKESLNTSSPDSTQIRFHIFLNYSKLPSD